MRKFIILFILFSVAFHSYAHPWKPKHYVIIDTDGGFDDFRAITLMLASPEIRVLAITSSPGVLPAEDTYSKINSMLKYYYNEGVLTGINNNSAIKPINCIPAKNFCWGNTDSLKQNPKKALETISYVYNHFKGKISFVCLGSLNIVAQCSDSIPGFDSLTTSVLWSNELNSIAKSFNYELDKQAFRKIEKKNIPISIVDGNSGIEIMNYNTNNTLTNSFSKKYSESFISQSPYAKKCFDEKTVLYLHYPSCFSVNRNNNINEIRLKEDIPVETLNQLFNNILSGNTITRSQVLKQIPIDTSLYQGDIQPYIGKIIERYGKEEWQTAVLANEMHRHLGVVATIGVKMGIRAREYFSAGLDELFIISHAGYNQPVSCLNDGLQASTGGTLGHALITVDTTVAPTFETIFVYMDRKLKITLMPEIQKKILTELRQLNYLYGLESNKYWELVRKIAVKYWLELDRHNVFLLEEL